MRGIDGTFFNPFRAEILYSDKNNDLAIIKITDPRYSGITDIPYSINSRQSEVGEEIFVLGYPLIHTMGDEIKLTSGIISAKSGYQDDITVYQISAPVQPGNSGGPIFNKEGNIIGIVSGNHTGTENVSYGVKSSYIISLLDLLDDYPILPGEGTLENVPLIEQVKILKKFVYILEVNY